MLAPSLIARRNVDEDVAFSFATVSGNHSFLRLDELCRSRKITTELVGMSQILPWTCHDLQTNRGLRHRSAGLPFISVSRYRAECAPSDHRPRCPRIGPYEVTALIGEGGMGRVWRAHHAGLSGTMPGRCLRLSCRSRTSRTVSTRGTGPRLAQSSEHRARLWLGERRRHDGVGDGARGGTHRTRSASRGVLFLLMRRSPSQADCRGP